MNNKIIGVTVGTPTSPKKIEDELKPVKTVNGIAPDDNGNVNVDGRSGTTPHIGANGNWYIGDTDTGVKAQGEPGTPGEPGQPGEPGTPGKDANVTSENIKLALGYTPANETDVDSLSEAIADLKENGAGGYVKSSLDSFVDNTDVDYAYDAETGANYTVIRVYREKIDGTVQYPFVYAPNGADAGTQNTKDLVRTKGFLLAINAGVFDNASGDDTYRKPDGVVIQNGMVVQNSPAVLHAGSKPLTISADGTLSYAEADADAEELVANGIVSAVCGFMPIIIDYEVVPDTEWNSIDHYTQNVQRQIIGQFGNGDYAIITCEGRNNQNSDGWTIAEAQTICQRHGLKFAYNLDGGGSSETMFGLKHINSFSSRIVPTFIVFNGRSTFDELPESGGADVVLTSISATYSGGAVDVGTALTDLTGIVVTAHYSDGTSKTVTGYILSGSIAVGNNTITVSYGGETTTVIVMGVTEKPDAIIYTIINNLTNVTTSNSATSTEKNTVYTATLKAMDGYKLDTVTVTMGGEDVTATAYGGGVVNIASVTGNVIITATGILADAIGWVEAENVTVVVDASMNTSNLSLNTMTGRACALSTSGNVCVGNSTGDEKTYYGISIPPTASKVKITLAECGGTPAPVFLNENDGTLSLGLNAGWQTAMSGIDGVYEFDAETYDYFLCNFKSFGSATNTIKIYFA